MTLTMCLAAQVLGLHHMTARTGHLLRKCGPLKGTLAHGQLSVRWLPGCAVKQTLCCYNAPLRYFRSMRDLTSPAWIKAKGLLFLLLGLLSATLLFLEQPALKIAVLLILAVWSFCRFYYFAFYVLERYVDPAYRFSGLFSLARYILRNPRRKA